MRDTLPPGYHLERGHLKVRFVYNKGTNGAWCFSDTAAIGAAWQHYEDPERKERTRAASTDRQAARAARNAALGRVRRGYYATPTEHESITAHLQALRGRGATVADPDDVLPEFRL